MQISIIDDKEINIKLLVQMLADIGIAEEDVSHAMTVETGVELLEAKKPDLLFLDIDLGHGYGFDVLNQTNYSGFELVFVTAHPNFALKSFNFNPLHYLVKPYTEEELREALQRFEMRKAEPDSASIRKVITPKKSQNRIAFPENGRIHFIEVHDIMYLEASNVYTLCHLKDKAPIVVSKSLGSYQEVLPDPDFCRIHERYIVNLNYVNTYTKGRGGEVELKNGVILGVASRRKDLFLKQIQALSIK